MKYILSFATGSGFTFFVSYIKGRLQKMQCHHIDDDIQSKIPVFGDDGSRHENIYIKVFKLINTTNKDISRFKIIFQFDSPSTILESYNNSKAGLNEYKMKKGRQPNECNVLIENFNRNDEITFTFKIANISDNEYYITESDCVGFKITCKDKRRAKAKIKSKRSSKVLTQMSPVSTLE